MKIVVQGLWHLGTVTAACLAEAGFSVVGLDDQVSVVADLRADKPPLFEPGLGELVAAGRNAGALSWSTDPAAVAEADLVWVAFDTPVDEDDHADTAYVETRVRALFPHLKRSAVVLISSQLPVGSTRALARSCAAAGREDVVFAYSPENLRLGKAIDVFKNPERIVIGMDAAPAAQALLRQVLGRFCDTLIFMNLESAEMVKHALNAFLATSVTFINEVASICEQVGANAAEVEEGLRSEPRIGRKAYIRAGGAFAGGTLARDVQFLSGIAAAKVVDVPMLNAIIPSNAAHRLWPLRRVMEKVQAVRAPCVAVLGLTYKAGTDALRRSTSVELCRALAAKGVKVQAYDPAVRALPEDLAELIALETSVENALTGADAAVLMTEWPDFRSLEPDVFVAHMRAATIIDQNRYLSASFTVDQRIQYVTIGKAL